MCCVAGLIRTWQRNHHRILGKKSRRGGGGGVDSPGWIRERESCVHCKKRLMIFPSPAGMSLTKRSLGGNKSIIPGHGESLVNDVPAGYGKIENLFLQCRVELH